MDLCNQLNYVRSFSPGKAYFYYLNADEKKCPLQIDKTHLRAPKGGYSESYTGSDFRPKNVAPQDLAYSNPQFIEECYVPPCIEDIFCAFSLRIRANALSPEVCSDIDVRETLTKLAATYCKFNGHKELATRYAKNLLSGSWVWRNKECRNLEIEIRSKENRWIISDATRLDWFRRWDDKSQLVLDSLSDYIAEALSNRTEYFYLDISAKLSLGGGDEVYPSQEFIDNKDQGLPTKRFATAALSGVDETVAFHSQKIGAAIQLIDDWWDVDADKPLRVNEYGADREYVIARRHSSIGKDFYSLIRHAEEYIEVMERTESIPNDVHFVMAVLVKGGLFNHSSTKKKKG